MKRCVLRKMDALFFFLQHVSSSLKMAREEIKSIA
jgi:hypothetical protein